MFTRKEKNMTKSKQNCIKTTNSIYEEIQIIPENHFFSWYNNDVNHKCGGSRELMHGRKSIIRTPYQQGLVLLRMQSLNGHT